MAEKRRPELIKCDVLGYMLHSCEIRTCMHPAIVRKYGRSGTANVSVWACVHCQFAERVEAGGMRCAYGETLGR